MGARIESIYQLGPIFFGLTFDLAPQARATLFTQIHEICFYGEGGYDWNTVYNMPIWLRRFTFKKIQDHHEKINEPTNKSPNQTNLIDSKGTINTPGFIEASKQYTKKSSYK